MADSHIDPYDAAPFMAVLTMLSEADARILAVDYGLPFPVAVRGIAAGSVNSNFALWCGDARYFLRLYEERDFEGAERETAMVERLARANVPTPAPLRRKDGRLVARVGAKPAAIFPWRDGAMRCQAAVSSRDAYRVGEALARVHVAGAAESCEAGRFRIEDLLVRIEGVERCGVEPLAALAPELRAELVRVRAERDRTLPQGLTHGDLFRDNVLWDDQGAIAALLDFESACAGTYAYDLMVTVLAWCVGDDLDVHLVRSLREGYESVRSLSEAERRALAVEGALAALRFTITRITDFALRVLPPPGQMELRHARAAATSAAKGPPPLARSDAPDPPAAVVKDWRRFRMRFERLRELGPAGVRDLLGA